MSNPFEMNASCPSALTIRRSGSGITRAPDGIATGRFWVQMLLSSQKEGEMTAMRAFVDPGVITHWHTHPRGQLLFVLDGVGRVQCDGGNIVEVRAGDSIWFAPGEKHWHGAGEESPFSYVSVQPSIGWIPSILGSIVYDRNAVWFHAAGRLRHDDHRSPDTGQGTLA